MSKTKTRRRWLAGLRSHSFPSLSSPKLNLTQTLDTEWTKSTTSSFIGHSRTKSPMLILSQCTALSSTRDRPGTCSMRPACLWVALQYYVLTISEVSTNLLTRRFDLESLVTTVWSWTRQTSMWLGARKSISCIESTRAGLVIWRRPRCVTCSRRSLKKCSTEQSRAWFIKTNLGKTSLGDVSWFTLGPFTPTLARDFLSLWSRHLTTLTRRLTSES